MELVEGDCDDDDGDDGDGCERRDGNAIGEARGGCIEVDGDGRVARGGATVPVAESDGFPPAACVME